MSNSTSNAVPKTELTEALPEIDYEAAIQHCYKTLGHAQGTRGCIAFAKGAEWYRDMLSKAQGGLSMSNSTSSAKHEPVFAAAHTSMRVDYRGLLRQARNGLADREPALAEMLRQFTDHIAELGQRYYAGDLAAVDEFLQLYCVDRDGRLAAAAKAQGGAS